MMIGRVWAFYNYGRKHFNQRGWEKSERLAVDIDVSGKCFVVTGANSGLGKCLTQHLFKHGAKVYMICRSEERANQAKDDIVNGCEEKRDEANLRIVLADCSLKEQIAKAIDEISSQEKVIDGLICNAGAMLDKRTMTDENIETTFAVHFYCGTYLLGKGLLPLLKKSDDPRMIIVTSGGQYTAKLERFQKLVEGTNYDAQLAYSKAKRAQVVLASEWAKQFPKVKIVSVHPGWTYTPALEAAYGRFSQWLLSPLRNHWQGTEGIAWLACTEGSNIDSGKLYLDGRVEPFHLHNSTKQDQSVYDQFMKDLTEN